jgi:hypothetical protein
LPVPLIVQLQHWLAVAESGKCHNYGRIAGFVIKNNAALQQRATDSGQRTAGGHACQRSKADTKNAGKTLPASMNFYYIIKSLVSFRHS